MQNINNDKKFSLVNSGVCILNDHNIKLMPHFVVLNYWQLRLDPSFTSTHGTGKYFHQHCLS